MKNKKMLVFGILVLTIISLSIGYSSYKSDLKITGIASNVRPITDIRVTGMTLETDSTGLSTYNEYNYDRIITGFSVSNNQYMRYKVKVTNIGSTEMAITDISGVPDTLNLELEDYTLNEKICNENNECKLGINKEFYIKLTGKQFSSVTDPIEEIYNLNLVFTFKEIHKVNYIDIENNNYPTEIVDGNSLNINFGLDAPSNLVVKIDGVEIFDYTYEAGTLIVPNVIGDVTIEKVEESEFSIEFCTYDTSSEVPAQELGARYICDLGSESRNFYLLELGTNPISNSLLESDEVALILEENYDESSYSWCILNGDDECAEDALIGTLDGISESWYNLSREQIGLPSIYQILAANGNFGEPASAYQLTKDWLKPNNSSNGYWSSTAMNKLEVWAVHSNGYIDYDRGGYANNGIRPVINLALNDSTGPSVPTVPDEPIISRLPEEYQEVEYVESTGTQYINSNYFPNNLTDIECKFLYNSITNTSSPFGTREQDPSVMQFLISTTANRVFWVVNGLNNTSIGGISPTINEQYVVRVTPTNAYFNGNVILNMNKSLAKLETLPMYIFGRNTKSGFANPLDGKIYYLKIYENEQLIRDLIPCYRKSDNEVGMYDLVNDVFYTNQGTGQFNKGNDI